MGKLTFSGPGGPLCDIGRDRDCGPTNLADEAVRFLGRKCFGQFVEVPYKLYRNRPSHEVVVFSPHAYRLTRY